MSITTRPESDSWGSATTTAPALPRRAQAAAETIRDDWDGDEDEPEQVEDPQKLWDEANKRAPMPQLVISASSTSGSSTTSPPVAAIQPVMRILKRPTATPTSSASNPTTNTSNSYAEREARYQAARERIFGDSSPPSTSSDPNSVRSTPPRSPPAVHIARDPKGPPPSRSGVSSPGGRGQSGDARGFGSRRGKRRGGGGGGKP